MKKFFFALIFGIVFLGIGAWAGAFVSAKASVPLALCTMGKTAVDKNYLTQEQFYKLAEDTGTEFKKGSAFISEKMFILDKETLAKASQYSNCSQVLVNLAKGYKK